MLNIYIKTNGEKILRASLVETDSTDILLENIEDTVFANIEKYIYKNGNLVEDTNQFSTYEYYAELLTIKDWFSETDYIPNKIVTGEWDTTDTRWTSYLAERKIKRARQDELNDLLA